MCLVTEFARRARFLAIERQDAQVRLVLDRPDVDNAFNTALIQELQTAIDLVAADPSIRVVVIEGAGDFAFSSGLDLAEMSRLEPEEAALQAKRIARLQETIARLDRPVICALKGTCVGLGLELSLFADFRIAREDSRIGLCTITVGLTPGGAALCRLTHLVGEGHARALSLSGGMVSAERAFVMGLVTSVVSDATFEASIDQLAEHLANLPPQTVAETKQLHMKVWDGAMRETSEAGASSLARCIAREETSSRLNALVGGDAGAQTLH